MRLSKNFQMIFWRISIICWQRNLDFFETFRNVQDFLWDLQDLMKIFEIFKISRDLRRFVTKVYEIFGVNCPSAQHVGCETRYLRQTIVTMDKRNFVRNYCSVKRITFYGFEITLNSLKI